MFRNPAGVQVGAAASPLSPVNEIAIVDAPAFDALVLDARLRQALVTVRSLGRRGLSVAALETVDDVPAFASRWCAHADVCAAREGGLAYLAHLECWLDDVGARVVIPSSDGTIALLRRYRERLQRRTRVALAHEAAMTIAINKELTLAVAHDLGIDVPNGVVVESLSDVAAALAEIGLPAVVKPVESWVDNEQRRSRIVSQLVTTQQEAEAAVALLTGPGTKVLFQQFLPGRREAVSFLYANGVMHARFAQWAKRTEPPLGGQSVLRQSIAIPPDIGEPAERLVRAIDLEGYSEVEFRRDSDGRPRLMEINPRLSASVEIAVRSGVDFPWLIHQWASGARIDKIDGYHTGNWMRYLGGDFMTMIAALQQRGRPGIPAPLTTIVDFCASFFCPAAYDYVDWRDPLPAVKAAAAFARSWVGGAIGKRLVDARRKFT